MEPGAGFRPAPVLRRNKKCLPDKKRVVFFVTAVVADEKKEVFLAFGEVFLAFGDFPRDKESFPFLVRGDSDASLEADKDKHHSPAACKASHGLADNRAVPPVPIGGFHGVTGRVGRCQQVAGLDRSVGVRIAKRPHAPNGGYRQLPIGNGSLLAQGDAGTDAVCAGR